MAGRRRWHAYVAAGTAALVITLAALTFGPRLLRVASFRTASAEPAAPPAGPLEVDPADLVAVARVRQRVGSDGGVVPVPGDLGRLALPPGALDGAAEVTAEVLHAGSDGTPVVDLRPDGLQLAQPARLELLLPAGATADDAEIVLYDPVLAAWVPEAVQEVPRERDRVIAWIEHFSLRRLRIRPGMALARGARRGAPMLETDASHTFEALTDGAWKKVEPRSPTYRELLKAGRVGRHDLIAAGRLRALAAGEPLRDDLRLVALPEGSSEGRTGWVRVVRLDPQGAATRFSTVARVVPAAPSSEAPEGVVRVTRATLEALGLGWDVDFGLGADGERAWIRVPTAAGASPLTYVPLRLESWEPAAQP